MPWRYEPRETTGVLPKHKWTKPRAGFEEGADGKHVGMCPNTMSVSTAEHLLNTGIEEWPDGWERNYPRAIYNFHDGVVYKALPTNPGISYHGFPCKGPASFPKKADMSVRIQRGLLAKAEIANCRERIEEWFKNNP
jgi:hypothetical protein